MSLSLSSPAFRDGEPIPVKYAGAGDNISPPLAWSGAPSGTCSFALIVEDPDAPSGTFRHWGLYNIMADRTILPEGVGHGVKTEQMGHAVNDFDHPRYDGPAPPKGHGPHHYHFRLAALDVPELSQAPGLRVDEMWLAARPHILDETELVGVFEAR